MTTPSRSNDERRQSAARTFERFVPDADPERVAASMERRYGALGSFAFETVGAMWDRPELSRRDRSLMSNPFGRGFVRAYYTVSPPIARLIARKPRLRLATRKVLDLFRNRAAL